MGHIFALLWYSIQALGQVTPNIYIYIYVYILYIYKYICRYTVKYIITTISVITMLIGLYDLYTNVPLFQNYITSYVDSVIRWIGSKVMGISPFSMNITLYFGVICAHAQGFLLTILSSSITSIYIYIYNYI